MLPSPADDLTGDADDSPKKVLLQKEKRGKRSKFVILIYFLYRLRKFGLFFRILTAYNMQCNHCGWTIRWTACIVSRIAFLC